MKNIRKKIQLSFVLIMATALSIWVYRLSGHAGWPGSWASLEQQVVLDWNQHALVCDRYAEGYNGPIAARTYAYLGLAAYETALPGLNGYVSLASRYPDLYLPAWPSTPAELHIPSALNACYATLFDKYFLTAPPHVQEASHELKQKWEKALAGDASAQNIQASLKFGREVALAVYQWSAKDSLGHQAFFHNFERAYVPPDRTGAWVPSASFPMPALLPYWGRVRTFGVNPQNYPAKPLPEYSEKPGSSYYIQALEAYTVSSPLSFENQWIAEFWSDDHHGLTFSPAGRWISIANQVVKKEQPPLGKLMETYLRLGLALHESFVVCWYNKYYYNLERPETFIKKVFNPLWEPLSHTPPFPAYPSGHATCAATASVVLTQLYGELYEMTDNSHKGRTEFKGDPRHFVSFKEMAYENAFSRIPLGAHLRMDCEEGVRLGLLLGSELAKLDLQTNRFTAN